MLFAFSKRRRTADRTASGPSTRMLDVAGRQLPLAIHQNPRSTRMTLRLEPGGRSARLTVPKSVSHAEIENFIERHRGWLAGRLSRFSGEAQIEPGGILPLRGVAHRIVATGRPRGVTETGLEGDDHVLFVGGAPEHLARRISDFLKREARRDLDALALRHAATIGAKVKAIRYKDTRSRWGSCTSDGTLSFSWRIVMAPPVVIDYLAAHEVAHLKEMNHGAGFWAICGSLCPDMEDARRWLKRNGTMLHAIDFRVVR
jgi:predicted metal-dependent hydrolase